MSDSTCPVCGSGFASNTSVRDHAWDVHGACHQCSEEFDDRDALYTHWLRDHGAELSDADRKRADHRVGDGLVCPVCETRFGSDSSVRDHAWDAHGACHRCGEEFTDEETLAAHWLGSHPDTLSRSTREQATATAGELTIRQRLRQQGPVGAVRGIRVSRRAILGSGGIGLLALIGGAAATGRFGDFGGGGQDITAHPSAQAISTQPTLGPPPTDADGTIIAFEDPSCPSCARFERRTFPELKTELIDPGTVSFVFRAIPVVYQWARPAVLALEAVHERRPPAFWNLKTFYFERQASIDTNNVLDATRQFLRDQTPVDAEAVMTDVDQQTHRDAVETNLQAANQANLSGTPTFYLFSGGAYRTKIVGPEGFTVFKNALGV